jgi:hypothetical protein
MNTNLIKNRIAWKIYFVWLFKRIIPLFIFEMVLLILAFYFLGKTVWVQKVFENAFLSNAQNPIEVSVYLFKSFLGTTLIKQIIIVALLGFGVLLARDIGRALISYSTTSRRAKQK